MALEVLFNKTENLHENVQFDRVALHLVPFFKEQKWDGLLIGNPFNEDYPRFRADAILLYTNGLIIIDFKDYKGEIMLPTNDDDFRTKAWFNNTKDGNRIKIEAGNNHTNPFKQLDRYRGVMKGIVQDDGLLRYVVDIKKICALNIFSGPITKNRETSRRVPYYQLKSELDLHTFLNQYASPNKFEAPIAAKFKALFPAKEWSGDLTIKADDYYAKPKAQHQVIDKNIEPALKEFYANNESGILVLESMSQTLRDEWMAMVNTYALDNGSPETDIWCHSSRIARKINLRTKFDVSSLYAVIYGGRDNDLKKEDGEIEDEQTPEESELEQELIDLKSDSEIDDNATIIIPEAHLVSQSLHQTDLMKFGTGRLLQDLIQFLRLKKTNRKIIFIGDPYMLSYGKVEDSALNLDTLNELFPDGNIINYRHTPEKRDSDVQLLKTRKVLGNAIDQNYFNNLTYQFDASLHYAKHDDGLNCIKNWFSHPFEAEPKEAVLFFSKKDARTTNLYIKKNILKTGKKLAVNDLLILNNNINIPDITGLGVPTKAVNGSYLLVKEVKEQIPETVTKRNNELVANLMFRRLKVQLLGNVTSADAEIIILENYLDGVEELSQKELVAFKIFINKKLAESKKIYPFEKSQEYQNLLYDKEFNEALNNIKEWNKRENEGEKVLKKDLKKYKTQRNKVERSYKKIYSNNLLISLRKNDPFINAALVNYGWAITVHKSVGSNFESILFKATQQEDSGITNASYFRWLYSGLTAANTQLFMLNPLTISPFDNCTFIDEVAVNENLEFIDVNPNLSFEEEDIPSSIKTYVTEDLNLNSLIAVKHLLNELEGYSILNIQKKSAYLIKVTFCSSTNEESILAINNKGNQEVSSIRIERTNENNREALEKAIGKLFNKAKEASYPEDFRKKIYKDWQFELSKQNCQLHLQESHQNEDRFTVTRNNEVVNFNLRYTTRERNYGFFSCLTIKEKSTEDLVQIIKTLVKND
ncbi:hypothetical protein [Haloflavibacter putidus]|uniref:NERD domain-containing protein n=1 Tax=Haloflavibacter putidus TaxID=2576776 RepID=A0A507ZQV4_9FLAO|nr:hypothetical protein [Haloflavibacter putidus]TQD38991.1 hypothetical protein FKR84_06210 [Haloflavibacter putidus]